MTGQRALRGLKTIEDARKIRARLLMAFEQAEMSPDADQRQALMTTIVVGGGPTGVEMAGAVAELARHALARNFRRIDPRSARVLLVEAGPKILATFPEPLSRYARNRLEQLGVTVMTGQPVEDITPDGATIGGRFIPAARSSGARASGRRPPGSGLAWKRTGAAASRSNRTCPCAG
jgi:NADH dehydrogenase